MNSIGMVLCSVLAVVVVISAASTKTENVPRSFSKPSSVETPTSSVSGTAGEAEGLERAEGRYYGGYGKKSAGNPFTIRSTWHPFFSGAKWRTDRISSALNFLLLNVWCVRVEKLTLSLLVLFCSTGGLGGGFGGGLGGFGGYGGYGIYYKTRFI